MTSVRRADSLTGFLLLPALLLFLPLFFGPLAVLFDESLKPFVPGFIGGRENMGITAQNYLDMADTAYVSYFYDTFRIGLVVTALGLILGFPLAHAMVRKLSYTAFRRALAFLVGMLFLSLIVRLYAILMTYGAQGPLSHISLLFGIPVNSRSQTEMMVVFGLLHTVLPLIVLTLIGTLQNLNPRLEEAALSLGASTWKVFLSITVKLSLSGILSAAIISYAFCISNLVVPLVLGRGFVQFVSNLIYFRFSEINNFPSGAAISIIMTVLTVMIFYGLILFVNSRWKHV